MQNIIGNMATQLPGAGASAGPAAGAAAAAASAPTDQPTPQIPPFGDINQLLTA